MFTLRTAQFFKKMGASVKVYKHDWGHIFPSIVPHNLPCTHWSYFSAKNCYNVDTANLMWSKILPVPKPLKPMAVKWGKLGKFYHVNAKPFAVKGFVENIQQLGEYARLFVPNKCLKGGCHLHVFLHGCT